MDKFVRTLLEECGMVDYMDIFVGHGIDRECLEILVVEPEMLKELIKPIGSRLKFKRVLLQKMMKRESESEHLASDDGAVDSEENWKEVAECSTAPQEIPLQHQLRGQESWKPPTASRIPYSGGEHLPFDNGALGSDESWKGMAECSTTPQEMNLQHQLLRQGGWKPFTGQRISPKEIILLDAYGIDYIKEMEDGVFTDSSRKKVVRILCSWLIAQYGKNPPTEFKIGMAKAIVEEFPKLRSESGEGFEAYYTPAKNRHEAAGYIENRLKNFRRREQRRRSRSAKAAEDPTEAPAKKMKLISKETDRKAHFSVAFTQMLEGGDEPQRIPFDRLLSESMLYDTESNEFNCTRSGSYFFTFSIHPLEDKTASVTLMKNGEGQVMLYAQNKSIGSSSVCSQSAILDLTSGDKVWLELASGKEHGIRSHPGVPLVTFTGFFIK